MVGHQAAGVVSVISTWASPTSTVQAIDQAEIDEVEAELGVVDALELLPGFGDQQIVGQLEARLGHAVISRESR
jgi:hypothetical protein